MSYSYRRYYNTGSGSGSDDPFLKSLEDQIRDQFETITKQKLQLNDQLVKIHQLEADLDFQRRSGNSASGHLKSRCDDLDRQTRTQLDIIAQLNDKVKRLQKDNYDLQAEKIALQNELSHRALTQKARQGADPSAEELIENLKYEIKCDQRENAELREKIERLEERLESQLEQLASKDAQINTLQSKADLAGPAEERVGAGYPDIDKKDPPTNDGSRQNSLLKSDTEDFRILEASTLGPKDLEIRALKRELVKMHEDHERNKDQLQHLEKLKDLLADLGGKKSFEDVGALFAQIKQTEKTNHKLEQLAAQNGFDDVGQLLENMDRALEKCPAIDRIQYFQGTIINNKKNGFGIEIRADGEKYTGLFKENQRHGMGRLETKDFDFTGPFEAGSFDKAKGTFKKHLKSKTLTVWSDVTYEGEVEEDRPSGKGRLVFPGGQVLEGNFVEGKLDASAAANLHAGEDVYEVSVMELPDMGISILATPDKSRTWVLNNKSGSLHQS